MNINNDNLYDIADKKTKSRVNTYIQEWKDKGVLIGYFGILAKNIYNRTRVKNSEILELLIYGAYIEEQSKLNEYEKEIMYEDVNYYYEQGQQEVLKAQSKIRPISIIDMALFLYLLEQANLEQYIQMTIQYNVQQIYKQVLINIQQQKELEIENNEFQRIINQQQNAKLCINNDKISGFMDNQLIGLNNQAKVQGIKLLDKKAKAKFISDMCEHVTPMCANMNGYIFNVNDWNEFNRWYGETSKDLKLERMKVKGLVLGVNLPPITHHFHWCHSTLIYQTDMTRKEIDEMLNMEYQDVTNRIFNKDKKKYIIKEQQYFIDNGGNKYNVDGKHVIMKPTEKEKEVAKLLGEIYGGKIKIIPRINEPENIKTPDYMIRNKKYDLKEIYGNSRNTIYNAITKKKEQADNFIFDISKTEMEEIEAIEQIQNIYKSKHKSWINEIILIKDNQILKMYKRK